MEHHRNTDDACRTDYSNTEIRLKTTWAVTIYLKIGCEKIDVPLDSLEELKEWFKGTGNDEIGDYQKSIMMELMPDLRVQSTHTDSCMTTFTVDDLPLISRQSDRVVVAVAGCGRGAKCSDELGRMAGELTCLSPK